MMKVTITWEYKQPSGKNTFEVFENVSKVYTKEHIEGIKTLHVVVADYDKEYHKGDYGIRTAGIKEVVIEEQ